MKKLILALALALALLPLSANAVEMWEGETKYINCDSPTTYTSGEPIEADDVISFTLYRDGLPDQENVPVCRFTVSPPVGAYIYTSTAVSAKYGSESMPSNNAELVVNVKKQISSPTNLRIEALPQE